MLLLIAHFYLCLNIQWDESSCVSFAALKLILTPFYQHKKALFIYDYCTATPLGELKYFWSYWKTALLNFRELLSVLVKKCFKTVKKLSNNEYFCNANHWLYVICYMQSSWLVMLKFKKNANIKKIMALKCFWKALTGLLACKFFLLLFFLTLLCFSYCCLFILKLMLILDILLLFMLVLLLFKLSWKYLCNFFIFVSCK